MNLILVIPRSERTEARAARNAAIRTLSRDDACAYMSILHVERAIAEDTVFDHQHSQALIDRWRAKCSPAVTRALDLHSRVMQLRQAALT